MPVNPNFRPLRSPGPTYNYSLKDRLNQTNYDVTNPLPNGGPVSFPQYGHEHKYSPTNTYLNYSTPGGNGSGVHGDTATPTSDFGIQGTNINPNKNIFKDNTSLDIENPSPTGGPNRTNSPQIPGGIYTSTIVGNRYGDEEGAGDFLRNVKNEPIRTEIHQYLPIQGKRYLDQNLEPNLPPVQKQKANWQFFDKLKLPKIDFAGAFNVGSTG